MPQANSTFSRPRATSPRASDITLPCSAVSSEAISLRLASINSRMWNITSARRPRPVARQAGSAALAAATAASTSATLAKSTLAACSPVAGLNTGPERPDVPSTTAPSIQCEILFIVRIPSDQGLGEATLDEAAVALGTGELVALDDDRAPAEHRVDLAVDLEALVRRVIHVHVVLVVDADLGPPVGIPDEDVGVGTRGDDPLG